MVGGQQTWLPRPFYLYVLASRRNGTLYIGITDNLASRVTQHRERVRKGFTDRHDVLRLVYFEPHDTRDGAFRRERAMKKWNRDWKLALIERDNPEWDDLYPTLFGP